MKTFLLPLCVCLTLAQAWAADSIKFNEVLRDVKDCYREEGETYCDTYQRNSGRASARVTIPGLGAVPFTEDTYISGRLGGLELGGSFYEAVSFTAHRVVFVFLEEYEVETGDGDFLLRYRRIGTITMSRSGDTLTINASFKRLPSSIVAESGAWEEDGLGQTEFHLSIGGTEDYSKAVYFKAKVVEKFSRDPDAEPLRTITAKGQADFTRPTVKIVSPKKAAAVATDVATLQGTAKDNVGVAEVQYRVGEDEWFTADGTTSWTADVPLAPGPNVVRVRSLDFDGLESAVATRTIIRTGP